MAWICSCGVHNAMAAERCRWCGKANPAQPPQTQPVPYQPPQQVHRPPSAPYYYPQQQTGPMAGYPLRSSVVNDLRAMGGTGAAKLTFGASMGAAMGWRVGKFLGCLGILAIIALIFVVLGGIGSIPALFARHQSSAKSESARAASTSSRRNSESRFVRNCVTSAENSGTPVGIARSYCSCALDQFEITGSIEESKRICVQRVLRDQMQQQESVPPAPDFGAPQ
ncbi:MAG: hypothetical protein ACRD4Q_15945 [Candidatus Acidiferrales bacterium]